MSKIVILFGVLAIGCYLGVALHLLQQLRRGTTSTATSKRVAVAVGMGGVTLHALVIHSTVMTPQGMNFSFFNALSLLSWLVAVLLLLASIRKPVENLGIAVLPLAALALSLQFWVPEHKVVPDDAVVGLNLHIFISILAFSVLNIAAIQALLLALQTRQLRNRQPGGFVRALPPLETMETLLFQIIGLGFMLQTLSLISGFAFLRDMFAQHMVHKTVLALAAWVVFGILLWGRWRFGWRGRTAVRWTLGGFITLLLAYIGSKLVLELVLGKQ